MSSSDENSTAANHSSDRLLDESTSQKPANTPIDHSHMKVTAHIPRQQGRLPVKIKSIESLSPTIKQLILDVPDSHLSRAEFLPGQWVDFHIPAVPTIGGFSICSTPERLHTKHELELAIKRSDHPPAAWVHEQANVGSEVEIEIGGEFVYDKTSGTQTAPAIFLIGGVGITPLISMIRQRMETPPHSIASLATSPSSTSTDANLSSTPSSTTTSSASSHLPSTTVIYTAKEANELIYRSDLESFRSRPNYQLYLSTTKNSKGASSQSWTQDQLNFGRLPLSLLAELLGTNQSTVHVYLCGPPTMVDAILPRLEQTISKERMHYEKWW